MPAPMSVVRQWIRDRRLAMGMSQQEAADKAGISLTTWNQVEVQDQPKRELTLAAVARALDWPHDAIRRATTSDYVPPIEPEPDPGGAAVELAMAAHGVDLEELRELDPEAWESIMETAKLHLARARERRGG